VRPVSGDTPSVWKNSGVTRSPTSERASSAVVSVTSCMIAAAIDSNERLRSFQPRYSR
jgi:hypothetical protein